jgi:hypothetical protein
MNRSIPRRLIARPLHVAVLILAVLLALVWFAVWVLPAF